MPDHVRSIMPNANIPMIGACMEEIGWPDAHLCTDLCFGMAAAGDGSNSEPGVRDTGIFRSVLKFAQYSLRSLCDGVAQRVRTVVTPDGPVTEPVGQPLPSSARWIEQLDASATRGAKEALQAAGVDPAAFSAAAGQAGHPRG